MNHANSCLVSIGAALYIVVYVLIGLTTVHPTGPIVLSSFALSLNVLPFIGSIPILVNDPTKMGTAYGVWSSFVACNNILLEVTAGAVVSPHPSTSHPRVIDNHLRPSSALSHACHRSSGADEFVARRDSRANVRKGNLPPHSNQSIPSPPRSDIRLPRRKAPRSFPTSIGEKEVGNKG